MIERKQDRRGPRNWPVPGDRRKDIKHGQQPEQLDWSGVAAPLPGTIRPAPGEAAPFVERRRVPESGME